MNKMKKLYNVVIIFFMILSAGIVFNACFDDKNDNNNKSGSIYGTTTYNYASHDSSAFYVILDDDTDESNGYVKRQIIDTPVALTSVSYDIDTTDVPAGSYYLLSGWDYGSGNMDPDDSGKWEAKAWYGGTTSYPVNPPSSSNITDLNEEYNITLISLP